MTREIEVAAQLRSIATGADQLVCREAADIIVALTDELRDIASALYVDENTGCWRLCANWTEGAHLSALLAA